MDVRQVSFTDLLSKIVDNRGRTCPTTDAGFPLIATNCVRNDSLYPIFENVRYISPETYSTWFRGHPEPGDMIFVCKGTPGRVCLTPNPVSFCIAQDMVAIRADAAKICPRYLFALLRSPSVQAQIASMHVGSLIPHFKKGDFGKLILPVPDRKTQEAIGSIYFEISSLIESHRQTNVTLEAMSRALFKSWFIDFDPVHAKLKGEAQTALDVATAALFPCDFAESELGTIPRGWNVSPLGSLLSLDKGVSYKGAFLAEGSIPMINLGCFRGDGVFDANRVKGYSGDVRESHWVAPGDLLLANTDMTQNRVVLGSPAIVPHHLSRRYLISHHVFAARFPTGTPAALPLYCYYTLLRPEFRARAAGFAMGTTVLALPRDAVLRLTVVLPPTEIIQAYGEVVAPLRALAELNATEAGTLAQLRDGLLPRLLSGELRVRDAERVVGAAV